MWIVYVILFLVGYVVVRQGHVMTEQIGALRVYATDLVLRTKQSTVRSTSGLPRPRPLDDPEARLGGDGPVGVDHRGLRDRSACRRHRETTVPPTALPHRAPRRRIAPRGLGDRARGRTLSAQLQNSGTVRQSPSLDGPYLRPGGACGGDRGSRPRDAVARRLA